MLAKKYYIKFAKIFNIYKVNSMFDDIDIGKSVMWDYIINDFINLLIEDNPSFNVDKFNKACNK